MLNQRVENIAFSIIALTGFALVVLVTSLHTDYALASHGFYHSAYVYQILNGIIPPTSIHTIGAPAGTYWFWHLLLAAVVQIFQIAPPEAASVINGFSLWLSLMAIWLVTAKLTTSFWHRAYIAVLPLIIINPFYGLSRITSSLEILRQPFFGIEYPEHLRGMILFMRFFDFSAFPFAASLFALLIALLHWGNGREKSPVLGCALVAFLIGTIHPAVALVTGILAFSQITVLIFFEANKIEEDGKKQPVLSFASKSAFAESPILRPAACY